MSYVHPDDIRILCRGLDRVWESFEEWVDPTAVPDPIWEPQTREEDPNGISSDNSSGDRPLDGVVWVEVRGSQSSGQPMLAIRPLTTLETQILLDQGFNSSNLIIPSRRSRQEVDLSVAVERQSNSKEWRNRTKCMGLEEGMKLPKQLNISALTSCPMSLSIPTRIHLNSQEDANRLKMPGSLPSTLSTTSAINCRQARSSNGDGVMSIPSMLAYPITTPIKPWALFMTIALDAWKQWIQTVHAGQAQFQDWREYVLETMIDQLIEGVCLGLTLLGLEDVPQDIRLEYESMSIATKQQAIKMESAGEDDSEHDHVDQERPVQFQTDCSLQQRKPSGIRRVAVILHHYPTVEGVVVRFGNSWLGQKIKNRLDNKLDTAAAHIVDWWYGSGNEDSAVATHGAKDGLHAVNNSVTIGDGIGAETDLGLVDA
ncbi:hypothetical protein BGZ99_004764 [Dissophora globulifera]|uniref:Uncharacterized protein n=1 Tax=Dissophora globulifera TaxID=979702 RepID=A0A9P6V124_9FUNG|nr:hypothetical protein BGZ99_004764 [Dissophora globulifera]